ncbi:MAG: hypothetical protein ACHQNA_13770, partial [Acidimicrobiales bacterium]
MPTALAEPRDGSPGGATIVGTGRSPQLPRASRAMTTPGVLRTCSIIVVLGIAALWVAGWTSATRRHTTVHTIGTRTEPLIVEAQQIHAALSEADASAAAAFLSGGAESPAEQARYEQSIATASKFISLATQRGETTPVARQALLTIGQQLPIYTGRVAQARALNRQNLPLGAAYLRDASKLMQTTILPATDQVAAVNAQRLDRAYGDATRAQDPFDLLVILTLVVAVLVGTQVLVFARTNRVLNVGLLAATVVLVGATAWMVAAFAAQRTEMVKARDQGFVPSSLISEARVLAFRAEGDQSLSVIARGNGAQFNGDFDAA